MRKILLTSSFWRGFTGLLIGGVLSYALVLAFAANKFGGNIGGILQIIAVVFFPPITGLLVIFNAFPVFASLPGPLFVMIAILFYPFVLGSLLYLAGQSQRRAIVVKEMLIVILVIALGLLGFFNS